MSQKIIKVAIPPIFGFYSRDSLLNSIVAIAVDVVVIVILFALQSDKLKQKEDLAVVLQISNVYVCHT